MTMPLRCAAPTGSAHLACRVPLPLEKIPMTVTTVVASGGHVAPMWQRRLLVAAPAIEIIRFHEGRRTPMLLGLR